MNELLNSTYWRDKGVNFHTPQGITFSKANDAIRHFSYFSLGGHIQAGSLMCFGGYNSHENINGVPGAIGRSQVDQLGSDNSEGMKLLEDEFRRQYPIFAGQIGGADLYETLYEGYKSYQVRKVLFVLVEFILQNETRSLGFKQLYIIGARSYEGTMTLIGDRSGLYSTFEKIFGYDFPKKQLYPIVQQDEETVKQWRKDRKLPAIS